MSDVVLINLPVSLWYKKDLAVGNSMPPLGVLYIATVLNQNNISTKVLDLSVENYNEDELKGYFLKNSPKIIGFSTYNESWDSQQVLYKYLKSILPEIIIFSGGAFATFNYEICFEKRATDYIVLGEGEYSALKLCKYFLEIEKIDIDTINGIIWEENGELKINDKTERIANLDELPIPDRSLVDLSKYALPFSINTARGCPGDCIFCSSKSFWGKKVYMRSAESIFREIMYIYDNYKSNQFTMSDDTFTASRKRAMDVCNMIKNSNIKFLWGCESRADVVDEELIRNLSEAGCKKIQFGLESGNNEILKMLKKHVTIEQIENAVSIAYSYGMHITLSFMIGHAFDTEETIINTLKFAKRMKTEYGAHLAVSVNTPFQGTEQYEKRDDYGITIHTPNLNKFHLNNAIISTSHLSINKIRYYYQEALKLVTNKPLNLEV